MVNQRGLILGAWCALLVGLLLLPLSQPGPLLLRDMVVLPHPALSPSALGLGDGPARNTPQDGVLALLGMVMDASWAARAMIVAAAALAALSAVALARRTVNAAAAATVALWNPFVVERLLQGHWSLVVAVWLLIPVTWAGTRGRPRTQLLCAWLASLTPTGAVFTTVTLWCVPSRAWVRAASVVCWVPWLLTARRDAVVPAESVSAFAPRAEGPAGIVGTLLSLGGIWNSAAVPPSRESGWVLFGVVLAVMLIVGLRRCPTGMRVLVAMGLGGAFLAVVLQTPLGWAVEHIPGAGLLRDPQKLLGLALPGYVMAAARIRRGDFAIVVLALALLQVPDAPAALRSLASPVRSLPAMESAAIADDRVVLIPGVGSIAEVAGRPVVQPWSKAVTLLEPGALTVDGVVTDQPNPRYDAALRAWEQRDMAELERLGVGVVATVSGEVLGRTEAEPPARGVGIGLLAMWCAVPGAALWPHRWRPTSTHARDGKQPHRDGGAPPDNREGTE